MTFVILPDTPAAAALAEPVEEPVLRYASGRPWIVGPGGTAARVVTAGDRRLAIIGPAGPGPDPEAALRRAGGPHDLDELARATPGSFHLVAALDGRIRVQGTLSTDRTVYHARVGGVPVAASGPAALARLVGAGVDPDALALRLLSPGAPWPLAHRPVWSGVSAVPAGHWLDLGPATARTVPWWRPPAAELPLADAAPAIRDALLAAVAARTGGVGGAGGVSGVSRTGADLSGGLDSTTLCFAAAAAGADLVTAHWRPLDPANDDAEWADRAAALLPGAEHLVIAAAAGPAWFATGAPPTDAEQPPPWGRTLGRVEHVTRAVAAAGARRHLAGVGGDELFGITPAYVWSLARRYPRRGLPMVHRIRVLNRWPLGRTMRAVADGRSFAAALDDVARRLTDPPDGILDPPLGWLSGVRMPPWATPDAVATARRLLRAAAAERPEPLDPDRVQHQILEAVVLSGDAVRQVRAAYRGLGAEWEAPLLDAAVVAAALSVRLPDRVAAGRYKPVLTAAVRGIVPDAVLARRSKGDFGAEAYAGLRENRDALLERCDDLHLARAGLVDPDALRAALLTPMPDARQLTPFENTFACEAWLRAQAHQPVGGSSWRSYSHPT
ncbi:asparagine synthase-related protein [Dactylosporangium sp. AC04546]|uniref:asparagine synthase-related protein n=1 Tax=Dactylosporangium sp. AC04546 TaxID=2862460 RepID=UPI001EDD3118|nr:asparagine synthase-related protein [Dactylosporangium sp. AC04546]WVK78706.1 asparagine synthase-related protein [Dactylosporangium sp. AC04546]